MLTPLVLASTSPIRAALLRNVGLTFTSQNPRIDEDSIRAALLSDGARPRDLADALAALKAEKVSARTPGAFVIGCDQVLDLHGTPINKPDSRATVRDQLLALRGQTHSLWSAIVVAQDGAPVWRHSTESRLTMRAISDDWLDGYLDRNWPDLANTVGGYKLEAEGSRLFSRIEGDYFAILGLPLVDLLNYLILRKAIPS